MKKEEKQIEIYVTNNTEIDNAYWKMKGFRRDIYVKYHNKYYKLTAMKLTTLKSILNAAYESIKMYHMETDLLIVKNLNIRNIIATILEQAKYHYFDMLKECEVENGEIIYIFSETVKKINIKYNLPISCPISKLIRIY